MAVLSAPEALADVVPLVVDLDGSLLHTDSLVESLFDVARRQPLQLLRLPVWLAGGRAHLKHQLATRARLDIPSLPLADDLLAHLRALQRAGRPLVLATGADAQIAQAVAKSLGLFDQVLASDGRLNLSGTAKRDRLVAEFGERGFDYVGNSTRDLPVWAAARRALLVRPSPRLAAAAARVAEVERQFGDGRPGWRDYLSAMRPQHWLKNLLLLVPLLAVHQLYDLPKLLAALLGFACFSLAASGVYLLNDLFDLSADRHHPHKKSRALASGRIPLLHGLLLVPALWLAGALLALTLTLPFLGALAAYVVLMLAYSMRLKHYPIVDTLVLAVGYSLRIYAGSLAVAVAVSPWLLVCSTALFFGLALLKRYAELVTLRPGLGPRGRVRGYGVGDAALIAGLGTAADCIAVVLLALYPVVAAPEAPHRVVWLLSALLLFWTGHMWLMAHRGRIHDDPVAFALRDPLSRVFGIAVAAMLLVLR
jgi:4-hydroxybenzoate polyprenyltransferase/phosphoglycolate phosphatase-like HAD superfamily hydrolase